MASEEQFELRPIGHVRSELRDRREAPMQGHEGAPDARIELSPEVSDGLLGLEVGQELMLVTWLHEADRSVLQVHPRSDPQRALRGVFATRAPDRPNPLGLHRVTLRRIDGHDLVVGSLEAIDGTPVVDIKPVLDTSER